MKETNRMKLYDYCKRYVRTIETRQDLIMLDPDADLEKPFSKLNYYLSKLENGILETVNDGEIKKPSYCESVGDVGYDVGGLIEELQQYPEDTPIWPQLHLSWGMLLLDFDFIKYSSLDGGISHELHMGFKKSKIYDELNNKRDVND